MSGIEIAGLVLAGFPLIVTALEHYRSCFEPLQDWWKFETEFSKFMNDLEFEQNRFDMALEKLLSPFIASDFQMNQLLQNRDGTAWEEPALQFQLSQRLGRSCEIFMFIVKDMHSELEALKKRLRIEKVMVSQVILNAISSFADSLSQNMPPETSKWEHELLRLRISFSRKKFRHIKSLEAGNTKLHTLLGANDELARYRRARKTKGMARFMQDARQRMESFHLALQDGFTCRAHPSHHCLLALEEQRPNESPEKLTTNLFFEATPVLRPIKVEIYEEIHTSPRDLSTDEEIRSGNSDTEARADISAGKTNGPITSFNSLAIRVKSHIPIKTPMEAGTKSSLLLKPKSRKRLRFQDLRHAECPPPTQTPVTSLIRDICSVITGNLQPGCLGYLAGPSNLRHSIFTGHSEALACDSHSLQDLDHTILSIRQGTSLATSNQRFSIALALASSLLRLDGTQWMNGSWNKSSIFFLHDEAGPEPLATQPYVLQSFCASIQGVQQDSVQRKHTPKACKDSFLALGIMLLELSFGETLESRPFRSRYLSPDGSPNEYTDFCTAKEWQTKVQEIFGDELSLVIDRCLDCSFGLVPDWNNLEFVEAVVADVVQPLQDFLALWNGYTGRVRDSISSFS